MSAQMQHVVMFVAVHAAGLVLGIVVGYVIAIRLSSSLNRSAPVHGRRGELSAAVAIGGSFVAAITTGAAWYLLEIRFAKPGYEEILDVFMFNHWLVAFAPAIGAGLRHEYTARWLRGVVRRTS